MGLLRYLESRLGIGEISRKVATEKYPPQGTSWLHTFGFAALAVVGLQAITGIALAFFYVPAADHAYDSIRFLERDVTGGKMLRALHHWGAGAMVVVLFVHALRVFFHGAYKRPREFNWLLGLGLAGVTLGLAFTGYLLPWDQKAYFATKVGVSVASVTPVVGNDIQHILYGGDDIGSQTLNRFFALHVLVLPSLLLILIGLHLQQIQRHGIAPVRVRVDDPGVPGKAFHPYHTFKEATVAIIVLGIIGYVAWRYGAGLEPEAYPADLDYDPRPDWYFLAPFQLLKYFDGDKKVIGAFYLPAGFAVFLALLPFLDRNPERRIVKRKISMVLGLLFVFGVVGLTVLGALDKPTHFQTPAHPLGASEDVRLGYDLVRRERCLTCHTLTIDGTVFGTQTENDAPDMTEFGYEGDDFVEYLADTGSEDMPSFPHLTEKERAAIDLYLSQIKE